MASGACSHGFIVFLCLIGTGLVGLGLLGAGIGVYVTRNDDYNKEKDAVDKAVHTWQSSYDPNSASNFLLSGYVILTPGTSQCNRNYLPLTTTCPYDYYKEGGSRYNSVSQKKYCATYDYYQMQICSYQVEIVLNKRGSYNYSLAVIPAVVTREIGYVEISMRKIDGPRRCDEHASCDSCKRKCASEFGGSFTCSGQKCKAAVYAEDLAVKVQNSDAAGTFTLDYDRPSMGPKSFAANALPTGFRWVTYNPQAGDAPKWQYQKLVFRTTTPKSVSITVRSSYDPWLTYLAETDGSTYFSDTEENKILAITLLVIGSVMTFCVLVISAYILYSRAVYKRSPESCPSGGLSGMAWNMGRGMSSTPPRQSQVPQAVAVTYAAPVYPPGAPVPYPGPPYAAAPYPGAYPAAAPYPQPVAPGAYPAYPPQPYPYYPPVAPQQQQPPPAGPYNGQQPEPQPQHQPQHQPQPQPQPQPQQQAPAAAGTVPDGSAGVAPA